MKKSRAGELEGENMELNRGKCVGKSPSFKQSSVIFLFLFNSELGNPAMLLVRSIGVSSGGCKHMCVYGLISMYIVMGV